MAYNLLKQLKTQGGVLNCYAVDTMNDLATLSESELEIIGCRAYCIFNGKFYIMNSEKEWIEAVPVFNDMLKDVVTRRGVYTWNFDPNIHDGIQEIEVEFIPTLQEFEETITRTGDYTFRYNKIDYDGFDDFTIHVIPTLQEIEETVTRAGDYEYSYNSEDYDGIKKITIHVEPTLQDIEEEIEEGGDYIYEADPEEYDGLGTVTLHVTASGNGDKVAVDEEDDEPDYLANKLLAKEGSGIKLKVNEDKKIEMKFDMKDYEIEYIETIPLASIQKSEVPTYTAGNVTFLGSSIVSSNSFSFVPEQSKFVCYSDSGDMKNCRFLVWEIDEDKFEANVIAYSEKFDTESTRQTSWDGGYKIEVPCEWSKAKIKGGKRYYIGLAGTMITTSWMQTFGYQSWACENMTMRPSFNVGLSVAFDINNPNITLSLNSFFDNGAHTIYFGVTH